MKKELEELAAIVQEVTGDPPIQGEENSKAFAKIVAAFRVLQARIKALEAARG